MKQCTIEGCPNKVTCRGWCYTHYNRWRKYGDPQAPDRRIGNGSKKKQPVDATNGRLCNICNQTKPLDDFYYVESKDWYYRHCKECHRDLNDANRLRKKLDNPTPPPEPVDHGECAFDGCDRKAYVQLKGGPQGWFCKAHYWQWNQKGELKPLLVKKASRIDDRFRRCKTCERVKTHDQFHWRTKGQSRQSECKECQYLRVRFNRLMVEGRTKDARAMWDRMAPSAQEAMRDRLEAA